MENLRLKGYEERGDRIITERERAQRKVLHEKGLKI